MAWQGKTRHGMAWHGMAWDANAARKRTPGRDPRGPGGLPKGWPGAVISGSMHPAERPDHGVCYARSACHAPRLRRTTGSCDGGGH